MLFQEKVMKKRFFQGSLLGLAAALTLAVAPCTVFFAGQHPVYAGTARSISVRTQTQLNHALKSKHVKTIKVTQGSKSLVIPKSGRSRAAVQVNAKDLHLKVRGRTGKLTINNARSVDVSGAAPSVRISGRDTGLILQRRAKVKNVSINGNGIRVQSSTDADIQSTGKHTNIQLRHGAENTDVDLTGSGSVSSVMNNTSSDVDLNIDDSNNILHVGSVYSGTDGNSEKQSSPLADDNPLRNYQGVVNDGFLSLEIHGCGTYSKLSCNERVHGWYHNSSTGTDYECYFNVNGDTIETEHHNNPYYEKNYLGNAAFRIVERTDSGITLQSMNNIYGDEGTTYTFSTDPNENKIKTNNEPIDSSNPLYPFTGRTESGALSLDIHGSGAFSSYSSGNKVHGWYQNSDTNSNFECHYIVNGDIITVQALVNNPRNQGCRGDATFRIISDTADALTLQSTSDTYGDNGQTYVFYKPGREPSKSDLNNPDENRNQSSASEKPETPSTQESSAAETVL